MTTELAKMMDFFEKAEVLSVCPVCGKTMHLDFDGCRDIVTEYCKCGFERLVG